MMATEKRFFDAKHLQKRMCETCNLLRPDEPCEPDDCSCLELIRKLIPADAVEVVRCKDCIHFDGAHLIGGDETGKVYCYGYCYHWDYEPGMSPNQVDGDDFCSYGERRTE